MPEVVFEPYSFLLDNTGTEPIVHRNGYGHIKLLHESDRVRTTMSFRLAGKRWAVTGSTLHIDGKNEPLAASWEEYAAIFADPDHGRENYVPKSAKKAKLPNSHPADEQYTPTSVMTVVKNVRSVATSGVTVAVEATDDSRYLMVASGETGGRLVYIFTSTDLGEWKVTDLRLISPTGYDITEYHVGHLAETVLAFLGADSRKNQSHIVPMGEARPGNVSNSVRVRRATVLRV